MDKRVLDYIISLSLMREKERTVNISRINTITANKIHAIVIDMENIYEYCHASKKQRLWGLILDIYTLIDMFEANDNKLTKIEIYFKMKDFDDIFKTTNWLVD